MCLVLKQQVQLCSPDKIIYNLFAINIVGSVTHIRFSWQSFLCYCFRSVFGGGALPPSLDDD